MADLILGLKIFFFIYSILIVLKNIYSAIKVLSLREGKMDSSNVQLFLLGSSISYIITLLFIGF